MKYVNFTATEQDYCTYPLWHYCDVRSPVYSMTSSKLCTTALFMKDTENVKNYCKNEVKPNSFLLRAYHIINGLWFIASQTSLTFTVVCPQKQKETPIVNPPLGIIKLNMSCIDTSTYLTYYPIIIMKANQTFKISSLIILNLIMSLTSKFGNRSFQPYLTSQKQISLQYWKTPKRFPWDI